MLYCVIVWFKFYSIFTFSCIIIIMTIVINKMDGRGLSNTARHERLPRRNMHPSSSNKTERFNYKGEWANT